MSKLTSKKKLREFGLIIGFGFPILIGWILPAITGHPFRSWTLWVAVPLLLLGILRPNSLRIPYKLWMSLGHALGWVNSRIILGLVFIVVLQPIALIMRLNGYDPLRLKKTKERSYREIKEDKTTDLKRIF